MIGAAISLLMLAWAIFLYRKSTAFHKGMAYPIFVLSPALLLICVAIILRSPMDLERVANYLQHAPEKISSDELPRMQKVMVNFDYIEYIELGIIVLGACMRIFLRKKSLWAGMGLGLMVQALLLLAFDLLAEKRGASYLAFLMQFS